MINERASNRDALLLAAGKLRRMMHGTFGEADAFERLLGARHALRRRNSSVQGRQLDVFKRGRAREQVELLKDEADLAIANMSQFDLAQLGHVCAIEEIAAFGRAIQAAENIHQCGLARAGSAHDGDEFAAHDFQRDAAESVHLNLAEIVSLVDAIESDYGCCCRQLRDFRFSWNRYFNWHNWGLRTAGSVALLLLFLPFFVEVFQECFKLHFLIRGQDRANIIAALLV